MAKSAFIGTTADGGATVLYLDGQYTSLVGTVSQVRRIIEHFGVPIPDAGDVADDKRLRGDLRIANGRISALEGDRKNARDDAGHWQKLFAVVRGERDARDATIKGLRDEQVAYQRSADALVARRDETITRLRRQLSAAEEKARAAHERASQRYGELKSLRDALGLARHATTEQRKAKLTERIRAHRAKTSLAPYERVVEAVRAVARGWDDEVAVSVALRALASGMRDGGRFYRSAQGMEQLAEAFAALAAHQADAGEAEPTEAEEPVASRCCASCDREIGVVFDVLHNSQDGRERCCDCFTAFNEGHATGETAAKESTT